MSKVKELQTIEYKMSQNTDQDNGVLEEPGLIDHDEESLVQPVLVKEFSCSEASCDKTTDINQVTDSKADIFSSSKSDSVDHSTQLSISSINENQVPKENVNKITNESDDSVSKLDLEENASQSRELKLLLALSKEANLDTNLSRKRKSLGVKRKPEYRGSPNKSAKIQYPVTAESELEMDLPSGEDIKQEHRSDDSLGSISIKTSKRKKSSFSDTSGDGAADEAAKKNRKSLSNEVIMFKPNKDMFCWRCHKDSVNISCETCPRSYHQKCLKQTIMDPEHWPCPECVSILKAESTQTRSPALKGMTLEHLCSLLKFAVNRMMQCQGSEPFIHAVNDSEFPDYKKYIIQPMDLTLLDKNIKENLYGSTQAFETDAKWILHNSIIFNSYMEMSLKSEANSFHGKKYQSKLTTVAKSIIKICKQEMAEIENCPTCYLNANTKKNTWFVEVCPKPHLLVWAKLRGFPYWPGKAMSCKDGMVDVRFFGAHDRAWVPEKECFLYTPKDPNSFRVKRADIEQCVEELVLHVENLKKVFEEFHYPAFKTPLDPNSEIKQIQMFLPLYKSDSFKNKTPKKRNINREKSDSNQNEVLEEENQDISKENAEFSKESNDDEAMEGYGTDDEDITDLDTEMRKNLMKTSQDDNEKLEADEDDTQVPSNIEPDKSGSYEIVLTKGALKSFPADRNSDELSETNTTSKRLSFDDSSLSPTKKTYRRDSDAKSESNKINHVDISENMEISLGNDERGSIGYSENISSSSSECSSDFSVELKKKPVQVDVDNAEFTISPASKLKISDKLIKRLSDSDKDVSGETSYSQSAKLENLQNVKKNISNDKLPHTTKLIEKLKEIVQPSESNIDSDASSDIVNSVSSTNEPNVEYLPDESVEDEIDNILNGCIKEKQEKLLPVTPNDESVSLQPEVEATNDKEEDSPSTSHDSDSAKSSDENSTDDNTPLSIISQHKPSETSEKCLDSPSSKETIIKKSKPETDTCIVVETPEQTIPLELKKIVSEKNVNSGNIKPISELVRIRLPDKPVKNYIPLKNQKHDVTIHRINDSSKTSNDTVKTVIDKISDDLPEPKKLLNNVAVSESETNEDSVKFDKTKIDNIIYTVDDEDDDDDVGDIMDTLGKSELSIDKAKIIDIIHSSLNDTSNSPEKSAKHDSRDELNEKLKAPNVKKRKLSLEENSEPKEKLFKSADEHAPNKSSDKENKDKNEHFSLLRKTLHAKKISRRSSAQNSPGSSTRSSIHETVSDDVKSEPESENEVIGPRDLEAKKKYLSALNILEKGKASQKPKTNEIRTRSKTEEKREQFRIIDNITKVIDDVALNYSATHENDVDPAPKEKEDPSSSKTDNAEIFVKSFAKISNSQSIPETPENRSKVGVPISGIKQRARKSFPHPNYNKPITKPLGQNSPVKEPAKAVPPLTQCKPDSSNVIPKITTVIPAAITTTISTVTSQQIPKAPVPPLAPTNGYLILQQPQQENLLLIPPTPTLNYASTLANQMVSMTPCLVSATNSATLRQLSQPPTIWTSAPASIQFKPSLNLNSSQNYIPQCEKGPNNTSNIITTTIASTSNVSQTILCNSLNETVNNVAPSRKTNDNVDARTESSISETERAQPIEPQLITENNGNDDSSISTSLGQDYISKAIAEIVKKPPPKLKPRPPGMLSQQFCEGLPSAVGPLTTKVNAVAHRMCDYFRGMLIETLEDFGKANNAEGTIASLKLEIETLKHRHSIELSEIEKNMYTILKDIKRSIAEEKDRIIEETRMTCEAETIKRIEDAKSKQWCANCLKEAQFYCCWNTSYCDYPCQQKHWPIHMSKCTQNVNQSGQATPTTSLRPNAQPLILRPANPPAKGNIGRVITKPIQKLYVNRKLANSKGMRVQTSTGSLLTMMETTPGNFQLMSNSLIRTGTPSGNAKSTNIVSITSSPNSSSSSSAKKNNTTIQPVRILPQSVPTTTVLDDDSD